LLFARFSELQGQINCGEFYERKDSINKVIINPVPGYDEPSYFEFGFENLYRQIRNDIMKDPKYSNIVGKVLVEFVVDTSGMVRCARVIRTDNEILNEHAIKLIESRTFVPARRRGKKVLSTLTLPIPFEKN